MKKRKTCGRVDRMRAVSVCSVAFLALFMAFVAVTSAQEPENFESPIPVLITEGNSTFAIAANPDNWRGRLPRGTADSFRPGQRVVLFVTNVDLAQDEGANAFRVFAADTNGKRFRLSVESIVRLPTANNVFALTILIFDSNAYNGQPAPDSEIALTLSWRGNTSNAAKLILGTPVRDPRGQKSESAAVSPVPNAPSLVGQLNSGDRRRFMEQAAFGPSRSLDSRLKRIGIRSWINEQFAAPYPTFPYPNFPQKPFDGIGSCGVYGTSPEVDLCHRNVYWAYNNQKWLMQEAMYGDDQLRRRVSWALHQIWVISHSSISQQRGIQEYIEILDRNAFGNYRNLMYEMTLSPGMGEYLDMARSTSQNPNENYPRELLQLFTVGLYMLNQDGTLMLDNQGNRIPTYDQGKIDQFTKVFTGWSHCNNGLDPACSNAVPGIPNYIDQMYMPTPNNHNQTAKTLFTYPGAPNSSIAACTNCTNDTARRAYATDSLNKTLDNIFYHPNVGPFIGKLLIQQLVTSDPSPAYVARAAAAFNNNGAGVRGDMKAVIKAVLLDAEARGSQKTDPTYGKLREPVQYIANLLRSFDVRAGAHTNNSPPVPAACQNRSDGVFEWVPREMGQDVWSPPSVFNYFAPDYVVPGTDILGPEFALANTSSSFARNNHVFNFVFGSFWFGEVTAADPYPYLPCGTSIDRSEAISWATDDPTGNMLIEGLNEKMMHGTMSAAMKAKIRTAINFPVDATAKASQAIFLVASSSQYQIQR